MPKICYVEKKFSTGSQAIIRLANEIIAEYQDAGYDLTLRQLYYQFVSRDLIANKDTEYKRLGSIINDARLAGLIDWEAIVDRTRNLRGNSHWDAPSDIISSCEASYAIDKWADQRYRPEVWIEKDALVGVIERVCSKLDVNYFSCRGYTSASEMWVAAQRLRCYNQDGQTPIILHLGDHDPSGRDMSRDIKERLELFGADINFQRIALNMDQIEQYDPPPNPAKITDSRSSTYIAEFGDESWELDALNPEILSGLVEDAVKSLRNEDKWAASAARERNDREALSEAAERWDEVQTFLSN